MKYNILADYVADLQTKGRYTFTRDEVQKALPLTGLALKKSLERLAKKGSIGKTNGVKSLSLTLTKY